MRLNPWLKERRATSAAADATGAYGSGTSRLFTQPRRLPAAAGGVNLRHAAAARQEQAPACTLQRTQQQAAQAWFPSSSLAGVASCASPPSVARLPRAGMRSLLQGMNCRLIQLNPQYHAITTRLFLEERQATPQEQRVLDQRNRLLARRNRLRDSQLEFLLQALAPLEQVDAPTTTADQLTNTHNDAMQRAHVRPLVMNAMARSTCLAEVFRHAEVQLDGLQESAAPCERILKLQRLMQRYRTLAASISDLKEVCQQRKQGDGHA
ncbi:hypothetical protein LL972_03665 [Xanthomonas campestris pv. asclepiadis]|uniref:hypothetical protein n=1 Tax=Xanthomonas campestris TaxID=339 RepID=UPI001E28987F|nr:hypothetical protein [Xanthomonas campestris]MCC4615128.1 hypothetical protein [Xanthomonas campestris pv. asclepiadis]